MDWLDGLTLGVAGIGAVLGLINTVCALWRDRVRIRVKMLWTTGKDGAAVCGVEVVNLSYLSVTLNDLRFERRNDDRLPPVRFYPSYFPRGEGLPVRMEARSSVVVTDVLGGVTRKLADWKEDVVVVAVTACGKLVADNVKADFWREQVQSPPPEQPQGDSLA